MRARACKAGLLSVVLALPGLALPASLAYFLYARAIQLPSSNGRQFLVIDEGIQEHARPDLGDLRIMEGVHEVPYTLQIERDHLASTRVSAPVMQPARVDGRTEFLLNMSAISTYHQVELDLATRNFVTQARVEGQDDPTAQRWTRLGSATLYDLTSEKQGHNFTLDVPPSSFKYLRVTIASGVEPADVRAASALAGGIREAAWRVLDLQRPELKQGRDTVMTFELAHQVPVDDAVLEVSPAATGFYRRVDVTCMPAPTVPSEEGVRLPQEPAQSVTTAIERIHTTLDGQSIDADKTDIELPGFVGGQLIITIHNEDDQPLPVLSVHLRQYERRLYFDATAGALLTLYYGDDQLNAPVYDYDRLFQADRSAAPLRLANETMNVTFTGRPDTRPWTDRHPALLWGAVIGAVLALGALALRSLRAAS